MSVCKHLRKEAAKQEVLAMSNTVAPLSSEEEAQSVENCEEILKEFDEIRGVLA